MHLREPHVIVRGRAARGVEQDRVELTLVCQRTGDSRSQPREQVIADMDAALAALVTVEHRQRRVLPVSVQRVEIDRRPRELQRQQAPEPADIRVEFHASKQAVVRYTVEAAREAVEVLAEHPDVEVRWPRFELSRARHLSVRSELLAEAVADAKGTASTLAEAAGRSLSEPLRIDEAQVSVQGAGGHYAQASMLAAAAPEMAGEAPTVDAVEPGYTQVEATVLVTYLMTV